MGLWSAGKCTESKVAFSISTSQKMAEPPKCKFPFCNTRTISTNTAEVVLLFVTVLFRLDASNKIAKLEVARLFLESASLGPHSWGVRAIMRSYWSLGLLRWKHFPETETNFIDIDLFRGKMLEKSHLINKGFRLQCWAVSPARKRSHQAQGVQSIYWLSVHCLQRSSLETGWRRS